MKTSMNSGLAISTYFDETTQPERFEIFQTCIESLKTSDFKGRVFIIDDCSKTIEHLKLCDDFTVIRRPFNGGTARVKNTSIKALLGWNCENLFLSDDDMIFKPGWEEVYLNAMDTMDMPHMAYICDHVQVTYEEYCGIKIKKVLARTTNGCFLTMTSNLIQHLGGFKVLPYIYGHSHENFSMRCLRYEFIPFYCDLKNAKEFIELNPASNKIKSREINTEATTENLTMAFDNMVRYIPIKE